MSELFHPKVSIIIPVFNGSDFLKDAIDSVLNQTYTNIEILVINDGSNDKGLTENIVLSYGDSIRYFYKPNGGVASALNKGIAEMKGDFFCWLSHDDLFVKNKIERQIRFLSDMDYKNTIIYTDFDLFLVNPEEFIPHVMPTIHPKEFRYWITVQNKLHGCTLLIPRNAFIQCGNFNENLRTTQDYNMWFRMASKFNFVHLAEPLVKARCHPGQGTLVMNDIAVAEVKNLLTDFLTNLTPDEITNASKLPLATAYAQLAAHMCSRGCWTAAWLATRLSFKNFPQSSGAQQVSSLKIIVKVTMKYFRLDKMSFMKNILRKGLTFILIKPLRKLPAGVRFKIRNLLTIKKSSETKNKLKNKFNEVYEKNLFCGQESRSGEGSNLVQTVTIRQELPKLIEKLGIKTMIDAPCGDWYWMKDTLLPVERYIGIDIVDKLVKKNKTLFGNSKIDFQCMDITIADLPSADLIFSRDCLVHLSFADAIKVISNFKRSGAKYLITTTFTERKSNVDLGEGFWRPLNKQLSPFNFPQPLALINEGCTEGNNLFSDKSLGLWLLNDINLLLPA